jgi:hypothetical protein
MTDLERPVAKILKLVPRPPQEKGKYNADLLEILDDVREIIMAGEIVGISMVLQTDDGGTYQCRAGIQGLPMVGRLEHLKADIVDEIRATPGTEHKPNG